MTTASKNSANLRSLCEEYEQGEKCSKYFFSLEKYRAKQKTLNRIKLADGSVCSDSKNILYECRTFYKNLYSLNKNVNLNLHPEIFTSVLAPKLTAKQKSFCDAPLKLEELLLTLKSFRKNKSPGLDGLTDNFMLLSGIN